MKLVLEVELNEQLVDDCREEFENAEEVLEIELVESVIDSVKQCGHSLKDWYITTEE